MTTPLAQARAEHSARVSELLRANNREVERRRVAEGILRKIKARLDDGRGVSESTLSVWVDKWVNDRDEISNNEVRHGEGAE